jgi:RNA polymerase sigma-70 factor (ECF subfamily)
VNADDLTPEKIERYRAMLKVHVRRILIGRRCRSRFDTSDVVHDAFIKALQKLDTFRGTTEAELEAWLKRITGNVLIDLLKKNRRLPPRPRDEVDGDDMDKEEVLILYTAIDRLPDAEQDAIVACYLLGLSVAETAARLERTQKGVAGLLYRGKLRLREILGQTGGLR